MTKQDALQIARKHLIPFMLISVFVYSGIWHGINMRSFSQVTAQLWFVPSEIRYDLPLLVPALQFCLAGMIFSEFTRKVASWTTCVVCFGFICLHIWNMFYGPIKSCECLYIPWLETLSKNGKSVVMIVINIALITLASLWLFQNRNRSVRVLVDNNQLPDNIPVEKGVA